MATNSRDAFDEQFDQAGQNFNVDPHLLKTIYMIESSGNPATRDSEAGAQGGMQIMPDTARSLGVTNARDMAQAIPAAAAYVRQGLDATGSPEGALEYYFGGPDQRQWGPKTAAYVAKGQSIYPTVALNVGSKSPPSSSAASSPTAGKAPGSILENILKQADNPQAAAEPASDGASIPKGSILDGILKSAPAENASGESSTEGPPTEGPPGIVQSLGAGAAHGLASVYQPIVGALAQLPGAPWIDKKFPMLGQLDQTYSPNAADEAGYQAKYGNNLAAEAGNVVGQTVASLPATLPLGFAGASLAASMSNPLARAGVLLGTGAAQGEAGAVLTGGDPRQGAIGGAAMGALGGGAKLVAGVSETVMNSPFTAAASKLLGTVVGFHFGDLGGSLIGRSIGEVIREIGAKMGPKAANVAAKVLAAGNTSGLTTGAAGDVAGQLPFGLTNQLQGKSQP